MFEGIKMAAKVAAIAVVTGLILALFANIQVPNIDVNVLTSAVSTALAVAYHWCPALRVVFPVTITLLGLYVSIQLFHLGTIAIRWIFKVNE